jgi:ribonuclease Z
MSDLRVVFLGTSSGKPTLSRSVSAVALVLDGELVLFDCGEGTQVQFTRAGLRPSKLVLACITHFHGDHINGVPGLLATMGLNQHENPVTIAGPHGLRDYFAMLRRLGIFAPRYPMKIREITGEGEIYQCPRFRISAAPVEHRIETWGFRFEEAARPGRFDLEAVGRLGVPKGALWGRLQAGETVEIEGGVTVRPEQVLGEARSGRVVAYVVDTRPCDAAVRLAFGADLLIHEGTYGPEMAEQAAARAHSTVVEAAEIAREAQVERLALTHLSPKYPNTGPLLDAARKVFPNTVMARDLMELDVPRKGE